MANISKSLPGPDNITRVVLDNGICVLAYRNDAAQSVVIGGTLYAGSQFEHPEQGGLASITAAALMRGTETRDFETIHASLEDIGADLDIGSGIHTVGFNGKALAEDLPVLIDVLSDALRHPTFPEAQVERLRGEIITGMQYRQQDTRFRASRAFRETLYASDHPYHHSSRGTLETVPGLAVDDMRAFHQRHYGPVGMILTAVGALAPAEMVDVVRERLGDWRNPSQPPWRPLPEASAPTEIRRVNVMLAGKTQSDIVLGVPGPSRRAADYRPAVLVNSVLGQFGMMGRIGEEVREKQGLAYYAYSSVEGGPGPGPWSVSAGVNPANVDRAIESITREIQRITREPVSETDLADNQLYFTGHLPLQLESNEGLVGAILNMELYDLGMDNLLTFRDRVNALTREDLLDAVRHYWNPDAFVISVAGPAS